MRLDQRLSQHKSSKPCILVSHTFLMETIPLTNRWRASFAFFAILLLHSTAALRAQHPANTNAYYQALRGLLPGGEVIAVSNLELRRDAATFTFRHGNFAFSAK